MKIIDSLQPEDAVYGLMIKSVYNVGYELVADCKHKDNIHNHGHKYHYERIIALDIRRDELETLKSVLEKYRKAI